MSSEIQIMLGITSKIQIFFQNLINSLKSKKIIGSALIRIVLFT